MTYRSKRAPSRWPAWLAIGLALLAATAALRMAPALFAPRGSMAARGLPTAAVLVPAPAGEVPALAGGQTLRISSQLGPLADVPAPASAAAPTAVPGTPEPARAEPTLTSTPVPLGNVGAEPIATLFPTQPAADQPPAEPAAQPSAGGREYVPILMYHYIRSVDPALDEMGYNLSIAPDDFAQQMAWLHDQGYTAVDMATTERCWRGDGACPPKPVALTFDDGYEDAFGTALPILQRYGMRGTFYIVNTFVGQPGYMTWEQLASMRDAGMEIGAHSVSHLNLTSLDQSTAAYEIGQSKTELDSRLGINVASFCYPAGFYDANIEALVQAAGFTNATTTRWDADYSDLLALPRRRVAGGTALDSFVGMVAGE